MTDKDVAVRKVEEALNEAGLHDRMSELPDDVPTAATAAAFLGCEVGAISNSVIFRAGDEPVLVLISGAHRVDKKKAAKELGVPKLSRADADFVYATTGQRVGGCAPVGHTQPVRTLIDQSVMQYDEVWTGGGAAHAVIRFTPKELQDITGAPVVDVAQ